MIHEDAKYLIQARMQQARECLDDGHFLHQANRSNRTVVNRAYYAAFYAALALLQSIGQAPRKHSGVLSFFDQYFVHPGHFKKDQSKSFHRLFALHQKDDYELIEHIPQEEAAEALQLAKSFVDAIEQYLTANKYL